MIKRTSPSIDFWVGWWLEADGYLSYCYCVRIIRTPNDGKEEMEPLKWWWFGGDYDGSGGGDVAVFAD